jgi:phenylpropionate dioxygenase-like ring-hydroxylating dioxygenase large terminal subunit
MFADDRAHSPALKPSAYYDPEVFAAEVKVLRKGWHIIGAAEQLAHHGDYISTDLCGLPVIARNEGGSIVAFINVCCHRQSLLAGPGCGNAQVLRCQYHGWEYDSDGKLAKLPDGPSFKGFKAAGVRLRPVRVETFGSLVYACADESAPGLSQWLAPLGGELAPFYQRPLELLFVHTTEHPVNWKVILENAVESYHVPLVHPGTYARYRDPSLHDHRIEPEFTRYADLEPWNTSLTGRGLDGLAQVLLRDAAGKRFVHAHRFPNQLYYFGDLYCDVAVVTPISPQRARHTWIAFVPQQLRSRLLKPLQLAWRAVIRRQVERIAREDRHIWTAVQKGVAFAEPGQGVLSAREERIFAFQSWLASSLALEGQHQRSDERGEKALRVP